MKEVGRIGYNWFLLPHSYSGKITSAFTRLLMGKKRTPLYPKPAVSFVSIVMYFILKTAMDLKITIWGNQLL